MINRRKGIITKKKEVKEDLWEVEVLIENELSSAYTFPRLTGKVEVGDEVILNTTAQDLGLGSGGYHFVMANLTNSTYISAEPGHIMKLRYTPLQLKVCAVEEPVHPMHKRITEADSLLDTPVISGSLHSMLVPCVCGIKAVSPKIKVAYLMTDGAALPLALSKAVERLKKEGFLCGTVTIGHAFGGDLEAVNLYSGLLAAKEVLKADVIIALMGPGVVGTSTTWGTTALEVGQIINAVGSLAGSSFTIPRLSFADGRERHQGLSHHTITALRRVALSPTRLVLPYKLSGCQKEKVLQQLRTIEEKGFHKIFWGHGQQGLELAKSMNYSLKQMGRSLADDPIFFLTAAAMGEEVAKYLKKESGILLTEA